jgi:hypothetical protein
VIGADTSEGDGNDYSTAAVVCVQTLEEVASFQGHLKPFKFAHLLKKMCELFSAGKKKPILAVERNNHGHAVLQELEEHIKYKKLYRAKDGKTGWLSTKVTRPVMIDQFLDALHEQDLKINSKFILKECTTLVSKNGKIQAAEGKHDDGVIAASIALQVALENAKKIRLYENVKDAILVG